MATVPPSTPPNPDPYATPQYEFSKEDNAAFENLAVKLGRIGTVLVLASAVFLAYGVMLVAVGRLSVDANSALIGLGTLLVFVHGVWFRKAAGSFQKIVDFRGKDLTNLREGLKHLGDLFQILSIVALVILTLAFVAAVAGVFTVAQSPDPVGTLREALPPGAK